MWFQLTREQNNEIQDQEKKLDLFNIVLIRKRIELEVDRLEQQQKQAQPKGWFSSWWSRSTQEDNDNLSQSAAIRKHSF